MDARSDWTLMAGPVRSPEGMISPETAANAQWSPRPLPPLVPEDDGPQYSTLPESVDNSNRGEIQCVPDSSLISRSTRDVKTPTNGAVHPYPIPGVAPQTTAGSGGALDGIGEPAPPPRPWYRRQKILIVAAVVLLAAIGAIVGAVIGTRSTTRNNATGTVTTPSSSGGSSSSGDSSSGSGGDPSPTSIPTPFALPLPSDVPVPILATSPFAFSARRAFTLLQSPYSPNNLLLARTSSDASDNAVTTNSSANPEILKLKYAPVLRTPLSMYARPVQASFGQFPDQILVQIIYVHQTISKVLELVYVRLYCSYASCVIKDERFLPVSEALLDSSILLYPIQITWFSEGTSFCSYCFAVFFFRTYPATDTAMSALPYMERQTFNYNDMIGRNGAVYKLPTGETGVAIMATEINGTGSAWSANIYAIEVADRLLRTASMNLGGAAILLSTNPIPNAVLTATWCKSTNLKHVFAVSNSDSSNGQIREVRYSNATLDLVATDSSQLPRGVDRGTRTIAASCFDSTVQLVYWRGGGLVYVEGKDGRWGASRPFLDGV